MGRLKICCGAADRKGYAALQQKNSRDKNERPGTSACPSAFAARRGKLSLEHEVD
jgi:hypothetical protein